MKDQVPADWRDKVLHARLVIGDKVIMGSDAERIFTALADQGKITMPFQKTFWSPGFGMAVDRVGIPWIVNSDQTG